MLFMLFIKLYIYMTVYIYQQFCSSSIVFISTAWGGGVDNLVL